MKLGFICEEHRLGVFENRLLMMFGCKTERKCDRRLEEIA
jgi:hypothetical protein